MTPSPVTTAAGESAWTAAHPGATHLDFISAQQAEQAFARASGAAITPTGIQFLGGGGGDVGGIGLPPLGGPPGTSTGPTTPGGSQIPCDVDITWTPNPQADPKCVGNGPIVFRIPSSSSSCGNITNDQLASLVTNSCITAALTALGAIIVSGILPASTGGSSQTPAGSGEGPIYVDIVQNSDIANATLRAVASSVAGGIDAATQQASNIANTTANTITTDLSNFAASFSNWQQNISSVVQQSIIGDLVNFLNPLGSELSGINSETQALSSLVNDITTKLVSPLDSNVAELNTLLTSSLATITQDLEGIINPFQGLVSDLAGITPFLSSTAGAISDIDKVLGRIGAIWTDIHSTLSGDIITDLKRIGDALAGVFKPISTVYDPKIPLGPGCGQQESLDWMQSQIDKYNTDAIWSRWISDGIGLILTSVAGVFHFMERYNTIYKELDAKECPLTRLDPGTVAQAAGRQVIDETSARDELLAQGFAKARQDVLFAMTRFLEPPSYALESWYRGVTTDSELAQILANNGYSQAQIDAAKEVSQNQLPLPAVLQAWLRGDIDESEVDKIVKAQKYNDAQGQFFKAETRRPASITEATLGHRTRDFLGTSILSLISNIDEIPQWFLQAGKSDGLNDDAIRLAWWSSLNRLDPLTWTQLYFKGLRDLGTVRNAFISFGIPDEFHIDFIDNLRPLIPFRSLSTLVKAGYMTPQQAKDELTKHGFSSNRVDILGKTFDAVSPSNTAKIASTVKGESVANARAAFDAGLITSDQYSNVLIQHGYSPELAAAQIQVDQVKTELKQRKQIISDLEAEVESGAISVDNALAQLHQANATEAEIAHFQVAVRRINVQKVKHPSIAELNKFYSAKLISAEQYTQELVSQGWQEPWLSAFLGLEVRPVQTQTPPGTP